jgi:hypothetical protein
MAFDTFEFGGLFNAYRKCQFLSVSSGGTQFVRLARRDAFHALSFLPSNASTDESCRVSQRRRRGKQLRRRFDTRAAMLRVQSRLFGVVQFALDGLEARPNVSLRNSGIDIVAFTSVVG